MAFPCRYASSDATPPRRTAMHASKRFAALLLSCASALMASEAIAAEPGASAGDCFVAGMKSQSADAVAACYAEDAIIWFPGGPMAKGRVAIRDGFAHFLAGVEIRDVELKASGHESMGDTRVAWGSYAIRMVDKATKVETVQRGRFTDVQKKIDGRWLYTVDHPSDDPPPAAQ
ncbi:MAG: nuclear transport factor 2 family protein [Lysobacteraceae bacterium]|nr:MAG: nuclear transport factor 2 family protein [Xanthomonadaceae bacterium]